MIEPKIVIHESKFATVWCYPTKRIIHHVLHQFFTGETFREILLKSAYAFDEYNCTKWLSDDRKFGAIHPDDKKWGDTVWRPLVMDAGWMYWAMVLPKRVVGQLNIQKMVDEYQELGVVCSFHHDPDDALAWLLKR